MNATPRSLNPPALYDRDAVIDAFNVLVGSGNVTELRVLEATTRSDRWPHTASGYFDNAEQLADALSTISSAKGIYLVPNAVNPALLARAAHRIRKTPKGESTGDNDIVRRRWLLIDCDPKRPAHISATDTEHESAIKRTRAIDAFLREQGWSDPIAADSGNGAHLLYRIDLPASDDGLTEQCLVALADRFDDDLVTVDRTVFNPSRIWKLYGTLACKGDHTADRPHRSARILSRPVELQPIGVDLLNTLAAEAQTREPNSQRIRALENGGSFDIESFIARHKLETNGPGDWQGRQGVGRIWTLTESPMCDHGDDGPHIIQHSSGAISSGCHHNSCSWNWGDLRRKLEPTNSKGQVAAPTAKQKPDQQAQYRPNLICMSDVESRPIQWLWPRRIAVGRIALLVGIPGLGKSFVTCDIASRISTGTAWPDQSNCPRGSVILITAEDDPHDTIRPRLDAHHADVSRVHLLAGVHRTAEGETTELMFSLADVDILEQALRRIDDCRLVIIDPIGSFIGGRTDAHRDNEVRAVLAPTARIAEKCGCAVLMVAHRRKSNAVIADDTALGSRAFTGIARSVWHLSRDPDNRNRRLLLPGKCNLAEEPTGLAFTIASEPPSVFWEPSPVEMTADDAMTRENGSGGEASALDEAADWLRNNLVGGARPGRELKEAAKRDGISQRTLDRAKSKLGVIAGPSGFGEPWVWKLPKGDGFTVSPQSHQSRQESNLGGHWGDLADTGTDTPQSSRQTIFGESFDADGTRVGRTGTQSTFDDDDEGVVI